jgi:energy-coupling factor transporter ATP-binding protein EcfA2
LGIMTKLIGITGVKGSGKSTLASMLVELIPDAEVVAFADALRDDANALLQHFVDTIPKSSPYGHLVRREWLEERKGTIYGPILQGLGEFARQWYGEDHWVKELDEFYTHPLGVAVIIPDVRYPNEAQYIHSKGGLLQRGDVSRGGGHTCHERRQPGEPASSGRAGCEEGDDTMRVTAARLLAVTTPDSSPPCEAPGCTNPLKASQGRFCSVACRRADRVARLRRCAMCGQGFRRKRPSQIYCSGQCRAGKRSSPARHRLMRALALARGRWVDAYQLAIAVYGYGEASERNAVAQRVFQARYAGEPIEIRRGNRKGCSMYRLGSGVANVGN